MKCLAKIAVPLALLAGLACSSTSPDDSSAEFEVDVVGERFVVRSAHPETIAQLRQAVAGRKGFPIGPLRRGDGGFNAPWSWHLDPAQTRFAEFAIEVCDARPSYVEAHVADFPQYCPWSARIIQER